LYVISPGRKHELTGVTVNVNFQFADVYRKLLVIRNWMMTYL